jgi:hypothetical protein
MEESAPKSGGAGKPVSWWHTLPGVLTALAAVITAVTGLVVAVRSSDAPASEPGPPAAVAAQPASGPQPSVPSIAFVPAGGATALPSGMEVRLAGGDVAIRILSARIEPFNREKRSLVFLVRHTNNSRYPHNFWVRSYRLVVDGAPRAPTNQLNELVDAQSAKDGEVVFEVPVGAAGVQLRISAGDEGTEIPFVLPAAQP